MGRPANIIIIIIIIIISMGSQASKLRFGIARQDGTPGGPYWEIRIPSGGEDVYIRESATKSLMHASLHISGQWHMKVHHRNSRTYSKYIAQRPPEQRPGLTHAYSIAAPATWGARSGRLADPRVNVAWIKPPTGDLFVIFDVFIDRRGLEPNRWPGYSKMQSQLVGRLLLPRGGELVTVVHFEDGPMTIQIPATPENEASLRSAMQHQGDEIRRCFFGTDARGAIAARYGYRGPLVE